MKTNNLWLIAVPVAVLALNGCGGGGGNNNGPGTPSSTATPIPTVTTPPGTVYDNSATFTAVSNRSNVNSTTLMANQSNITTDSTGMSVLRLTEQMSIVQSRNIRITGNFDASSVGQSIPISATSGTGIAMADYEQNDGGTLSRWEATSGTVVIDQFTPPFTSGADPTVRYRLIKATFVPSKVTNSQATGTFTLSAKGAIN